MKAKQIELPVMADSNLGLINVDQSETPRVQVCMNLRLRGLAPKLFNTLPSQERDLKVKRGEVTLSNVDSLAITHYLLNPPVLVALMDLIFMSDTSASMSSRQRAPIGPSPVVKTKMRVLMLRMKFQDATCPGKVPCISSIYLA